jgi:uncharacterized protein
MLFDRFTIALMTLRPDAPRLDDAAGRALQDAHLEFLAELHEAGQLLAAGPLQHERFRGLSILNVEPERALELKRQDPAVRAGRLAAEVMTWIVPGRAVAFSPASFPCSIAEAED